MAGSLLKREQPLLLPLLLASLAVAGCVREADLTGRPCPCTGDFVCCDRMMRCYPRAQVQGLSCTPGDSSDTGLDPVQTDAAVDAARDFSVDTPVGSPSPDAAADRARDLIKNDVAADVAPDVPRDMAADIVPDIAPDIAPDVRPDTGDALPPCGSGNVRVSYFDTADLAGQPVVERSERGLTFDWADGAPGAPPLRQDFWSALVGAAITPQTTDDYTLFLDADDGVRLWLDGELVIDWWRGAPGMLLGAKVHLEAGRRYPLSIEYYEFNGLSKLALSWQRGDGPRTPLPSCVLDEAPPRKSSCPSTVGVDCIPEPTLSCGAGKGLTRSYSRDGTFAPPDQVQQDASFSFDWSWLPESALRTESWSTRWEGMLLPPKTDTYTFSLISEGAAELTIAGQTARVENDATGIRVESTATARLEAGRAYPIRLAHTTRYAPGWAVIQLRWKSAAIGKGIIPTCFLSPSPAPDGGARD
jgi:hypothetical protein